MTQMPPRNATSDVPPLLDGTRMDRDTFHRVYCLHPEIRKAELIDGVVRVASPVSAAHADAHADLVIWCGTWSSSNRRTRISDNITVILDELEFQPDVSLSIRPERGGTIRYSPELYLIGAPDLIAEIAVSTEALDTGARMEAYRAGGVQEYIVWRVLSQRIDWHVLKNGQYELLLPDEMGIVRSESFAGLWLDVAAMLAEDMARVLTTLRAGIATLSEVE